MNQNYKVASQVIIALTLQLFFQHAVAQNVNTRPNDSKVISLTSELEAFYRIAHLPAYRDETVMGQVSSYDRTGGNDDGFSGRYSYIRRLPDSSLVLFDEQGPGVINRIWTPTPSDDSLDFYIDDSTRAAFTISYKDLFSGKVVPFVAPLCNNQLGGFYCYLPITFQERCLIIFRGKQTQFYQIGYRSFPKGTRVQKFNLQLNPGEKAALQKIRMLWNKSNRTVQDFIEAGSPGTETGKPGALRTFQTNFPLKPGERKTIMQINKGGRIVGIELEPASAFEGLSKDIDIKITWDNETHPAVYCPVADFFGYAFGRASMQSLLAGSSGQKNYCYFPMPFDRSATIELIYRKSSTNINSDPLNISAQVFYLPQARVAAKEGKFYARWNHQDSVPLQQPHVFLNATGKGHYTGTVLQARGLEAGMTGFFEGDDSTVADGKLTMHGTGSEDYFNGGWYAMMDRWDGAFSLPLSGSLDYTLPLSRTGGYRLFITDKIPFTKSIHHSIEHGPERNAAPATYTSVSYYYCNTPPANTVPPRSEQTRVSMPDTMTIFPQLLTINTTADLGIHRLWAYNTGGESIIFTSAGESGVRVHLQEIPEGAYQVFLDYVQFPQGCSFSLWQRQTPLTDWMDARAADTTRMERQYVCDVTLTPLNRTITLRFQAKGKNNQFFLNRIFLVRNKRH